MCIELEVLTILPMAINLGFLLKLRPCYWKYLQASILFEVLVSFLQLFSLMLNAGIVSIQSSK